MLQQAVNMRCFINHYSATER